LYAIVSLTLPCSCCWNSIHLFLQWMVIIKTVQGYFLTKKIIFRVQWFLLFGKMGFIMF
jgi:uncharacterized membrane protein